MKPALTIFAAVAAVALIAFGVYMIDIDQTEEASLPDVDVQIEGGNLPEFDAEVGSIELTEEKVTVPVPEVDVTTREEVITVPGLSINAPDDAGENVAENQ